MKVEYHTVYLKKRFPLRISRGVFEGSDNLYISLTENGHTGWGEMGTGRHRRRRDGRRRSGNA